MAASDAVDTVGLNQGIADGDAAWYRARRAQFGEVYREFCVRCYCFYQCITLLDRMGRVSTHKRMNGGVVLVHQREEMKHKQEAMLTRLEKSALVAGAKGPDRFNALRARC